MRTSMITAACVGALAGCTTGCPEGQHPATWTALVCDATGERCREEERSGCVPDPGGRERAGAFTGSSSCDGISGVGEWVAQEATPNRHVIDGRFTGDEWEGATRLEGLLTDVYMDYRDGRLYFLNDWRANEEGIEPGCYNYFAIRVGASQIELKVFESGAVDVRRDGERLDHLAAGAYGFTASPEWQTPHTIYEFALEIDAAQIDVCCYDPLTRSECATLVREPAVVSVRTANGRTEVRRDLVPGSVVRVREGGRCGDGSGVCADGLSCESDGAGGHACAPVAVSAPDAGAPPFDGGPPS